MKCPRCQGLMVRDQIFDTEGPFVHIDVWRCLNCGKTTDLRKKKGASENSEKEQGRHKFQAA